MGLIRQSHSLLKIKICDYQVICIISKSCKARFTNFYKGLLNIILMITENSAQSSTKQFSDIKVTNKSQFTKG